MISWKIFCRILRSKIQNKSMHKEGDYQKRKSIEETRDNRIEKHRV